MDKKLALNKAAALCSASEKCAFDIKKKLATWELTTHEANEIVERLIAEKFIDHNRYAPFFVRDKFKFNKWGRIKIGYELRQRGIESSIINEALNSINENDYINMLTDLMKQRLKQEKKTDDRIKLSALLRFGASRGFESNLCYKVANKLVSEKS